MGLIDIDGELVAGPASKNLQCCGLLPGPFKGQMVINAQMQTLGLAVTILPPRGTSQVPETSSLRHLQSRTDSWELQEMAIEDTKTCCSIKH